MTLSLLAFITAISAARFDRFDLADDEEPTIYTGTVLVGPVDPPTQCLDLFGRPDQLDCEHMLHQYLGLSDNEDSIETVAEVLIGRWATTVTQVRLDKSKTSMWQRDCRLALALDSYTQLVPGTRCFTPGEKADMESTKFFDKRPRAP